MIATIREDIIIATGHGDTEIGNLPAGVGIERLRWDGERLVDLAGVETIHVRRLSGYHFELHCLPVADSQPVAMTWADRKRLTIEEGGVRLKTLTEIEEEGKVERAQRVRHRYAKALAAIAAPYSPEERETWPIQLSEAEAYIADPTAPVAMITEMARQRGITVADLAAKIMHNNSLFRGAVGELLGRQQRELDNL